MTKEGAPRPHPARLPVAAALPLCWGVGILSRGWGVHGGWQDWPKQAGEAVPWVGP